MLSVQRWGLDGCDKELRAIRIGSSICHTKQAGGVMLKLESFILKLFAIDTFATRTVAVREIAPLKHELRDHAMKNAPFIVEGLAKLTKPLFASAQTAEVFGCLRHIFAK